jgi:5-formyltetrahydrofolate cyclo-ligase
MMSTPSHEEIRAQKLALRKRIRAATKVLTVEEIQSQSQKVWDQVFELPVYQSAKTIGLFLSMPKGEINTDAILKNALENGKDVYVPQVGQDFEKCDMDLLKVVVADKSSDELFHKSWPKNKWQIPEPPADMPITTANPGDIDLLVVPGLAFDQKCNRLGQGKGYYDRFIARMTENGASLPLVAVAMQPQLVEDVDIPVAEYDKQMDMVVLPERIIYPPK